MKIVITAVGLLTLMTSACSSTTKGASPGDPSPETKQAVTGSSEPATSSVTNANPNLKAQLLTVSDLPVGWAVDNTSASDIAAPGCLKQAKAITDTPHKARADFVKGTDHPALSDSVGYYGSSAIAQQKFAAADQLLTSCKDVSFDQDGTHVTGTIGALSFPNFGDQSAAWRFTFSAEGESFGAIEVLVRKGDELELLGLVDVDPSVDELESVCRAAVGKLP